MTEEVRQTHIAVIREDTNEMLIDRFVWYVQNFNPVDFDRCDDYALVKEEIIRRMTTNDRT